MSHLVKALWDELWFVNMGYTNKIWLIDWLSVQTFTLFSSFLFLSVRYSLPLPASMIPVSPLTEPGREEFSCQSVSGKFIKLWQTWLGTDTYCWTAQEATPLWQSFTWYLLYRIIFTLSGFVLLDLNTTYLACQCKGSSTERPDNNNNNSYFVCQRSLWHHENMFLDISEAFVG